MAEAENKYLKMVKTARELKAEPAATDTPAAQPVSNTKGRFGRPPGKRSNPEFRPITLILREATTETARRNLKDRKTGLDLSELVEQLLSKWNREGD